MPTETERKANAVRYWNGQGEAVASSNRGGNENAIRTLFCKGCKGKVSVKVTPTKRMSQNGIPISHASCQSKGCGNNWNFPDMSYLYGDRSAKKVMTVGDCFATQSLNGKPMATIEFADKMGLLNQDERAKFGVSNNRSFSNAPIMTTTTMPPRFDRVRKATIKCCGCGTERATDYHITSFRCPECSSNKYNYMKVNGRYI